MIRWSALALLLLVTAAQADGLKEWKDEQRQLDRAAQKYWHDFQKRFSDALIAFDQPRLDATARPNDAVNYVPDYTGLRSLYADFAKIEEARGKADLALAASGDEKALAELFDAFMDVGKRIDDLETQLLKAKPQQSRVIFDLRPGVERNGIALRWDALVRALAQCPGATALLAGDGMKAAAKKDGKGSVTRRAGVIDALGLCPGEAPLAALTPYVNAPESSVRIAALEAIIRRGPSARPAIEPLLNDASAAVRRALLEAIATSAADDPGWIAPVLATYRLSAGLVRRDCVRALGALTNQRYGDAQAGWDEWFADYKSEIEGGKFRKDAIEVREVEPAPSPPTCTFFGIPTPAPRIVFVIEASRRLFWPNDVDVLLTQLKDNWEGTRRSWEDKYPSNLAVLLQAYDRASAGFGAGLMFGALALHAAFDIEPLGSSKLMEADKRDIRAVRHDIERLPGNGWCSQYAGLLEAAKLLGMGADSDVDFPNLMGGTIYLWGGNGPAGGRYMTPDAAVAAFKRFNRFRRLVVHAIRIADEGADAETLMKGLAEASGGTYVRAKKPPQPE